LGGHPSRCTGNLAEQNFILLRRRSVRREMFAWNNQDMYRRRWIDVPKSDNIAVLVNNIRWDLAGGDVTKRAVSHE
jgi:hypothetical protein